MILAIDPGRDKCGVAVIDMAGRVVERDIAKIDELAQSVRAIRKNRPEIGLALIGDGTGHQRVCEMVDRPYEVVPERGTTLRARAKYFKANPPPWWLRWIPLSMRVPPEPIDDWAAVVIAEDYLILKRRADAN